jgi:predicted NUDIX family NTP pyrophosphohydrolase
MPKRSAGLLMYRHRDNALEVFLVHPGGPFWAKKDLGAWTLPKGEYTDDEEPLAAAIREFREETGFTPEGDFLPLGDIRQAGGKLVTVWALEGDCDPAALVSIPFEMEWPPRSSQRASFPEVDRGAWFSLPEAHTRILASQQPILDRLAERVRQQHSTYAQEAAP